MKIVFVSAIILSILSAVSAYSYLGCYVDKPKRLLGSNAINSDHLTVEMCLQACTQRGNYFAAVEWGHECWCGNILQPYDKVSDSKCSKPCKGDSSQKCGAWWKASVYTTDADNYLGCYEDKPKRILEGPLISLPVMTSKICIGICKLQGKRFALTEYSTQCICGNHLRTYPKKPESQCNYKCKGDTWEMCGGFWRGSLYLISYNDL